jgi:hypothetical protein
MSNVKSKVRAITGVRRLVVLGVVAAAFAGAAPGVAYAINDPRVPANECSPDNSAAVGDPLHPGNPGINDHTPDALGRGATVSPFVSGNNPGASTGALGQQNSNAIGTCPNSLP